MLGRFAFVRLKAVENALRDGRIDEAFQIVRAADLREHRRGQKLLTRLGKAFLDRARSHVEQGAFGEALLDLDRSEEAGGKKDEVAALRQETRKKADDAQVKNRYRRERLDAARRNLAAGSLRGAKDVLDQGGDKDSEANRIRRQADGRLGQADAAAQEARQFFEADQIDLAIERCVRAKSLDARCRAAARLESEIATTVLNVVQEAFREGRLDQASRHLAGLGPLGASLPDRQEAEQILELARRCAQAIFRFDLPAAKEAIQRLQLLAPKMKWIEQALAQVEGADDAVAALRGGPITLALEEPMTADPDSPTVSLGERKVVMPSFPSEPAAAVAGGLLPESLLLMVDGAASFLLLRQNRVSIGRMNSEDPADIPLVSDLSGRHAEISRIEDDYFFSSPREVKIGGRAVRQKLLADGDKICLNRRTTMTFRIPSRRSSSAVLDLGDHVRSIGDVRQIVLLNGNASLGSNSSCHLKVPRSSQRLLLFEREGQLWVRPQSGGNSHPGGAVDDPVVLPLGQTIEMAGMRLVLEPLNGARRASR